MFVKTPPWSPVNRLFKELPGLTRAEARFYAELATEVPVQVPRCYRADRNRIELQALPQRWLRRPSDWCSRAEAQAMVDALADLHSRFWEDARLNGWLTEMRAVEIRLGNRLAVPLMRRGLTRAGVLVPRDLHAGALDYARRRELVAAAMSQPPLTLVHHDCHLGNLYFTDDVTAGFFDWQLVRAGQWARDVAYFCATSLRPQDRRAWEQDLLARYLDRLGRPVAHPWLDYRRHATYAFEAMVVTLALGQMMADHEARTLVARTAIAVGELRSFEALP